MAKETTLQQIEKAKGDMDPMVEYFRGDFAAGATAFTRKYLHQNIFNAADPIFDIVANLRSSSYGYARVYVRGQFAVEDGNGGTYALALTGQSQTLDDGLNTIVDIAGNLYRREQNPSGRRGEYDIVDFGASLNSSDNSAAIQAAINAAENGGGGDVIVPPGHWEIQSTLNVAEKESVGMRFIGSRGLQSYTLPNAAIDSTALVWTGANGGTMLNWMGAGGRFHGALWGRYPGGGNRAAVGLDFNATGVVGVGHLVIDGITIADCGIAMQTDDALNCADLAVLYSRFSDCDEGVYLNNAQALNWTFFYSSMKDVGIPFHVDAGGLLHVTKFYGINTPRLLYITGDNTGVGTNNGAFHFENVDFDSQQSAGRPVIVEMTQEVAGARRVEIGMITVPRSVNDLGGSAMFNLSGQATCRVRYMSDVQTDNAFIRLRSTDMPFSLNPQFILDRAVYRGSYNLSPFADVAGPAATYPRYRLEDILDTGSRSLGQHSNLDPPNGTIWQDTTVQDMSLTTTPQIVNTYDAQRSGNGGEVTPSFSSGNIQIGRAGWYDVRLNYSMYFDNNNVDYLVGIYINGVLQGNVFLVAAKNQGNSAPFSYTTSAEFDLPDINVPIDIRLSLVSGTRTAHITAAQLEVFERRI